MTMTLVETIEVGAGGAASIEFTSIPQDADDLLLVVSGRSTGGGNGSAFRINGDTGSNYSYRRLYGFGSGVGSDSATDSFALSGNVAASGYTANTFGNFEIYFSNYTSSTAKSWSTNSVAENNATSSPQEISAGRWSQTSAITSLLLYISGANFAQYSTASLYKVKKA